MDMPAEVSLEVDDQRISERYRTNLESGVRRSGSSRIPGIVRDLSRSGFRIDAEERLPMDSVVWLKVGHLAPLMARVVWSDKLCAGCRFAAPLHPSVLAALIAADRG